MWPEEGEKERKRERKKERHDQRPVAEETQRSAACSVSMAAMATSMSAGMGLRRSRVPLRIECAHKKGSGSTKNGRDSNSKRLGVKVYGGQHVTPGGIIVRQRGSKVRGDAGPK